MPEHLQPQHSPYNTLQKLAEYDLAVAKALVYPYVSDSRVASLVCCASFEPEWSLFIDRLDGNTNVATVYEADTQIWGAVNPSGVKATSKSLKVESAIAETFAKVCVRLLRDVRHPDENQIGLDGAFYHFFFRDIEFGFLSGSTWSPRPASPPGKLVSLSHALRRHITHAEGRDSSLIEIQKLIHWFRSQKLIGK
ncbi:hypothetical protein OAH18_01720 [bacterium]|nr:hypothetical protein [bacterium]